MNDVFPNSLPDPGSSLWASGGELGARVKAFDWGRTSLGPITAWPHCLRTAVGMVLASPMPMALLWGPEGVAIYNDAYAAFAGRHHPHLLGSNILAGWPELAEVHAQILEKAHRGQSTSCRDRHIILNRNGAPESIWLSLDGSPVFDEAGRPVGALTIALETTQRILADRALRESEARQTILLALGDRFRSLSDPLEMIEAAEEILGRHLGVSRVGYGEVDASERFFTTERNWTDGTVQHNNGEHDLAAFGPEVLAMLRSGHTLVVEDVLANPETSSPEHLAAFNHLQIAAVVTATLIKNGKLAAAMYVHDRFPHPWTASEIKLVEEIAERTWEAVEWARAEAALRESDERLKIAQRAGKVGAFEWYPDTGKLEVSDEYRRIWGLEPGVAVTDELLTSLVDPDHRKLTGPLRQVQGYENPLDYAEYRITRPDTGEVRWIARRGEVTRSLDHEPKRFVGVAFDITERKQAEAALLESEERFRLIANSSPLPMWISRLDSSREFVNSSYCGFFGLSVEEAMAFDWLSAMHPDDLAAALAERPQARADASRAIMEARYRNHLGQWRWLRSESQPRWDANGEQIGFIGVAYDVTEAKQARETLEDLNRVLKEKVEASIRERDLVWMNSNELMAVFGFDGYRKSINPAWARVLGYDEETLLTIPFIELTHPDDKEILVKAVRDLAKGQYIEQFEDRLRHADGSYRLISWTGIPGQDEFYAIGRDITEQRAAEDALRQAQKMEAVGQLTGGIAHDFNNLLTGITGSLDLLQRRISEGRLENVDRYIEAATSSANRAAALTHRLLAFARRQSLDVKPVDVSALVVSMEDLLRRTLSEDVVLVTDLQPGLWPALTDHNQLESALLNLVLNSRDAMPEGGVLNIGTRNASIDKAQTVGKNGLKPGEYTVLSVSDTGGGMSESVKAKAFDPFFTTKPIGQGTGLGLSMIYGFVKQSQGYVHIDSSLGHGTRVELYLPRSTLAVEIPEGPRSATIPHAEKGETVLVVEDDAAVRMLILDVLSELGYEAIEAVDAQTALPVLRSSQTIDLMVSDVGLPGGINGRQLATMAREHRPDLKILFVTGYAEGAAIRGGFLDKGMTMITKPFAIDELGTKIREMIEEG